MDERILCKDVLEVAETRGRKINCNSLKKFFNAWIMCTLY